MFLYGKTAGTIAGTTALWRNAVVPVIMPGFSLERNFIDLGLVYVQGYFHCASTPTSPPCVPPPLRVPLGEFLVAHVRPRLTSVSQNIHFGRVCVGVSSMAHVRPYAPLRVPLDECIAKRAFWKGLCAGFFYGPCTPPLDERFAKHVFLIRLCGGFVHGPCTPIRSPAGAA